MIFKVPSNSNRSVWLCEQEQIIHTLCSSHWSTTVCPLLPLADAKISVCQEYERAKRGKNGMRGFISWEGEAQPNDILQVQRTGNGLQNCTANPKQNLMTLHEFCECSWQHMSVMGAQPCCTVPLGYLSPYLTSWARYTEALCLPRMDVTFQDLRSFLQGAFTNLCWAHAVVGYPIPS